MEKLSIGENQSRTENCYQTHDTENHQQIAEDLGRNEDGRWNISALIPIAERSPRSKILSPLQQELQRCAEKYRGKQAGILLTPREVGLDYLHCHIKTNFDAKIKLTVLSTISLKLRLDIFC